MVRSVRIATVRGGEVEQAEPGLACSRWPIS